LTRRTAAFETVKMKANPMDEDYSYQPLRTGPETGPLQPEHRKVMEVASSNDEILAFLRDLSIIVGGVLGIVGLLRLLVMALAS
jgi:hypothetical protein